MRQSGKTRGKNDIQPVHTFTIGIDGAENQAGAAHFLDAG